MRSLYHSCKVSALLCILRLTCCSWAAQYNTWLLVELTLKGVVFLSFLNLLLLVQDQEATTVSI